jgi:uroporphyrinogen-III synthase
VTAPLAGLVVVVTRPARQAARLLERLQQQGATAIAFPTIVVEPVALDAAARTELAPGRFDWIVYTSANAVELSVPQIGRPGSVRVAAIGRATARVLADAGIRVDAVPESGADTEALLAHTLLARPRGLRFLLVKGVGGRDALRAGLEERGAIVRIAEVYRRTPATPSPRALAELQSSPAQGRVVVVVTSVEILESLLALVPESVAPWLRESPLLLPGERVAAEAHRRGWRGPLVVARSAEDATMVETLRDWIVRNAADPGPGDRSPA